MKHSATPTSLSANRRQGPQKPFAIVVGLDSMQGLQTARILARHGVPVVGVSDNPNHPACGTRACHSVIQSSTTDEELVRTLHELGSQLDHKAVLVPCEDTSVLVVSRYREQLAQQYHFVLPAPDVVEMLMDKSSFYSFARKHGLPVPATHIIRSFKELVSVASEMQYPVVLKPRNSSETRWENTTYLKAFKVDTRDELLSVYRQYDRCTDCFVLQEWIDGGDSSLYSCNCYFNNESQPLVTFVAKKIRQWPPETGISCLGEECRDDTVLQETLRLFRSVGYRGLGYLEMKQDRRTGKYFIVEPNVGRPTGRSAIAEAGGVQLLYTMYCDALGWPLPQQRQQVYGGVKWIHLRKDFQSAYQCWRRGDLTIRQWWQSVRGKKAFALAAWSDPTPFFLDLLRAFRSSLSPRSRRQRTRQHATPKPAVEVRH